MSVLFSGVGLASNTETGTGLMHVKGCQMAWREQRSASGLPGDSQVSKWQERMLTSYFPHSPDGEAGFENEKAGSPPPWLGAAHPQLSPPGNLPGKVQKSGCLSSQGQRREGV